MSKLSRIRSSSVRVSSIAKTLSAVLARQTPTCVSWNLENGMATLAGYSQIVLIPYTLKYTSGHHKQHKASAHSAGFTQFTDIYEATSGHHKQHKATAHSLRSYTITVSWIRTNIPTRDADTHTCSDARADGIESQWR